MGKFTSLKDDWLTDKQVKDVISAERVIQSAMERLYEIPEIKESIPFEHVARSPERIAKTMLSMFEGCFQDPHEVLQSVFTEGVYDEIIYVNSISFVSMCAHHNLPFLGKAHFGYLPDGKIIGLSKIPRL